MRRLVLVVTWFLLSTLPLFAQPADESAAAEGSAEEIISSGQPAPTAPLSTSPAEAAPGLRGSAIAKPLPAARTIMLDVRSLDIDHLLKLLGDAASLTIVKDPAVTGPVTIICPYPVSIGEALEILNAILEVRGFTAVQRGQVLKITTLEKAIQTTTETHVGRDPENIPPGDRIITQIVPLASLDATELAAELAPLAMLPESLIPNASTNTLYITDSAANVRRLLGIINEMEERNSAGMRVFRLQYVGAEEMADLIGEFFNVGAGGGAGTPYERRLLPRRGATGPRAARSPQQRATAATGTASAQIIPDTRTNSLIVMASPERVDMVEQLILEFDRPVDYSSTLAFISLQHARADDVANLLAQAFGGAARTSPTSTQMPINQGTRSRTTGPLPRTQQSFLRNESASEQANPLLANNDTGSEEGDVLLAQAPEAPSQGRTGEGRVVPLIEATDVIVIPDPATNSLIINASPEQLELVKAMVKQLDVIPTQVLIQAIVAEVTLSKRTQLGLEFSLSDYNIFGSSADGTLDTNFGVQQLDSSGDPIPLLGLSWTVLKPDRFSSLLNALGTDSDVHILSTPRIFTTSGKEAIIDVSTQVPFATGQFVSDIGGGISTTFDYQSVGIVLEVTPLVSKDGSVAMEISQTADDLLRFESLAPDLQLPVVSKRLAQATVSVQDGYTVVLGGLMSDRITHTETGIPIVKDLPLIGWAFRSRDSRKEKTELLVFLTPRVVRAPEESRMLTEQQQQELKKLPKIPVSPGGPEG